MDRFRDTVKRRGNRKWVRESFRHERMRLIDGRGSKKGERGEASLSGLMTLRRSDESTPAECY